MTDNRTTKRLMAMLEERGVKYELEHDLYVEWVDARGNDVTAFKTSCKHKGDVLIVHVFLTPEQAIAATLGNEREAKLIRAMEDVLRHATDTVWVSEIETLVDRMVSLGVYKHDVYEGVRPWEASHER